MDSSDIQVSIPLIPNSHIYEEAHSIYTLALQNVNTTSDTKPFKYISKHLHKHLQVHYLEIYNNIRALARQDHLSVEYFNITKYGSASTFDDHTPAELAQDCIKSTCICFGIPLLCWIPIIGTQMYRRLTKKYPYNITLRLKYVVHNAM